MTLTVEKLTPAQIEARILELVAWRAHTIEGERRRMAQLFDLMEARQAVKSSVA